MSALDEAREKTGEALDLLYALVRTRETFGPDHTSARQQARALGERLAEAHPPFTVQLSGGVAFRDRELVPLDPDRYERVRALSRAARDLGVGELGVDRAPDEDGAQALAAAFGAAMRTAAAPPEPPRIPGLWWGEVLPVQWGMDAEEVDPETFARTQVVLSVRDARGLRPRRQGARSWDFVRGLACVRRVQEALEVDPLATVAALERAPTGWDPARRAVSAAAWASLLLGALDVRAPEARAAAHAALILGAHGFADTGGVGPRKAAAAALPRLLAAPAPTRGGLSPHRLRVLALVDAVAEGAAAVPAAPVVLAHALERQRVDADGQPRPRAALVAWLATRRREDPWARVLLATVGADAAVGPGGP